MGQRQPLWAVAAVLLIALGIAVPIGGSTDTDEACTSDACLWSESGVGPGAGRAANPPPVPPSLVVRKAQVSEMKELWRDKGSGARKDMGTWQPQSVLSEGMNFSAFGSYAAPDYDVEGVMSYYKPYLGFPLTNDAMASPVSFTKIYIDKKSGAKQDGSAWQMNCPVGYVSLGDVWTRGYSEPAKDNYACVNKLCAEPCPYRNNPAVIWSDAGSGGKEDATVIAADVPKAPSDLPVDALRSSFGALGTSFVYPGKPDRVTQDEDFKSRLMCLKAECRKRAMIDQILVETFELDRPLPKKGSFHFADEATIENMTPEPAVRSGTLSWEQKTEVKVGFSQRVLFGQALGMKTKIEMGMPGIGVAGAETETSIEYELEFNRQTSKGVSESESIEIGFEVVAPPHSNMTAKALVQKADDVTVPFTTRLRVTAKDFDTNEAVTDGDVVEKLLRSQGFEGGVIGWNKARNYLVVNVTGELEGSYHISTMLDITCESFDPEACMPMTHPLMRKLHTSTPLPDYAKPPPGKDINVHEVVIEAQCPTSNPSWDLKIDNQACKADSDCIRYNCVEGKCKPPRVLAVKDDGLLYKRASLGDRKGWVRYGVKGPNLLYVTHEGDGNVLAIGTDHNVYKLCQDARAWTPMTSDGKVKTISLRKNRQSFFGVGADDGRIYTMAAPITPASTWQLFADEQRAVADVAEGHDGALFAVMPDGRAAVKLAGARLQQADANPKLIAITTEFNTAGATTVYGIKAEDKLVYSCPGCPGRFFWDSSDISNGGPVISLSVIV